MTSHRPYLYTAGLIAIGALFMLGAIEFNRDTFKIDQDRFALIDTHYQSAQDAGEMPGARAVIFQGDKVIYERNWGYQNIASKTPIQDDTIFHLFSMTKPITSVAVMILFEEGKLLLHEPIAKYIPELANLRVYDPAGTGNPPTRAAKRQPTISDFMKHTSGVTYGVFDGTPVGAYYRQNKVDPDPTTDLQEFVRRLGQAPLAFEPGAYWNYGVSTDVLGRLVEVVSGQKFSVFLQERLFDPLKMVDTSFHYKKESRDRVATIYAPEGVPAKLATQGFRAKATGPGLEPLTQNMLTSYEPETKMESGGGGLISTTADYLRFARMLLNGGSLDGQRILSPMTVNLMRRDAMGGTEPRARLTAIAVGKGIGFGHGFGMITNQAMAGVALPDNSFFWGGAAGTFFWVDPDNQLIGMFMTQILPHRTTLRQDIWPLTYQAVYQTRP